MTQPNNLLLIDGTALVYRMYFALIKRPLMNSKGENTSAVFGFTNTLMGLLNKQKPDYIAVVFDAEGPTFRHEMYEEYKATREKMPDDLYAQIPIVKELTAAMGIPVLSESGVEADDIIGSLAVQMAAQGLQVQIMSSDKDFAQLVTDQVIIRDPGRSGKGVTLLGIPEIIEKFGVRPDQIIDYMALVGDTSDNVPGVPKIGPKTAAKLLEVHGTLDALYEALDQQTPTMKKRLIEHKDDAYLSQKLVTILTDLQLNKTPDDLVQGEQDTATLERILLDLEFHKLLQQLSVSTNTQARDVDTSYHVLSTTTAIDELCQQIRETGQVAMAALHDYDQRTQRCYGLAFCTSANTGYFLPLEGNTQLEPAAALGTLQPLLEDPSILKHGHDLKEVWIALNDRHIDLNGLSFDTMIGSYLLNATLPKHDLDVLASQYLNRSKAQEKDALGSGKGKKTWGELFFEEQMGFSCEEADLALQLVTLLQPMIEEAEMGSLMADLEMPLIPVLGRMEQQGIALHLSLLSEMAATLNKDLESLQSKIREWASNPELNINSSKQIAELLFEQLRLHEQLGVKLRKNRKSGSYSTDSDTLEALSAHELPQLLLDYRSKAKLLSTYIEALPTLCVKGDDGVERIHTRFRQSGTVTGRLSSFSPNLQNIPVRTEQGRAIRNAFITANPEWKLVSADYSQIELRILAHISQDKELMQAFHDGIDIHTRTASLIFNIFPSMVTPEQRSAAKATNFGIVYGIGPTRLAKQINVTNEEAEQFIKAYFQSYPLVKAYLDTTLRDARKNKYVETLLGRKRHLHDALDAEDGRDRSHAENIAVNTPIQGTAADLIKKAMIQIDARLREDQFAAHMLLQVHDELLFEAPIEELPRLQEMIKQEMTTAFTLSVPLVVDIGVGDHWAEAH